MSKGIQKWSSRLIRHNGYYMQETGQAVGVTATTLQTAHRHMHMHMHMGGSETR